MAIAMTHESYIARVAELAISRLNDEADRARLRAIKLTYGAGPDGVRGITYYQRWQKPGQERAVPFVGINAMCQENPIQLAGTTIHELGHVLAPLGSGHDKPWHDACDKLGLHKVLAAGHVYEAANFDKKLWASISRLKSPDDGQPVCNLMGMQTLTNGLISYGPKLKACTFGVGSRGGRSRGSGSGSRLLKYVCEGNGHAPSVVRASAGANFDATCNHCQSLFRLA